ncbi:MAG TPA: ParB/RepB/Spo0J family partition protein [Blastocatellia bacterium]|nr:ParB/RepB/Spo0J family partition protein [Blastocatellia bacterium]
MSKRGLPDNFRLRHDSHYVELLTNRGGGAPIGRMIPIDKLAPNPSQPRVEIGDLAELTASIIEKGVLEPILVRPSDVGGRFMIISGERRYRASLEAGLTELPCIEMDVDDRAVAEISLIENLQRKDLTPFEEADGLLALAKRFGYKHDEIAQKLGKARTSVTETISIANIPPDVRELCRRADISSKSMLLQVARQPTDDEMREFVIKIGDAGLTRDQAREIRQGKPKIRNFCYQYDAPNEEWSLTVKFRKPEATAEELKKALKATLNALNAEVDS